MAEDLKRVIKRELQDEVDARPDGQKNVRRQAFSIMVCGCVCVWVCVCVCMCVWWMHKKDA